MLHFSDTKKFPGNYEIQTTTSSKIGCEIELYACIIRDRGKVW